MSYNIDMIRRIDLISSPETINTDWSSPIVSLDNRFGPFSISFKYANGVAPNMNVYVQFSNTEESGDFASLVETLVNVSDASGNLIYDLNGAGTQYARIFVDVVSGSIDVTQIRYIAQQAH